MVMVVKLVNELIDKNRHEYLLLMSVFFLFISLLISQNLEAETIGIEPPGQLVEVDGRNMHINCLGNKSPTVILDSGAGGFSLEWKNIQKTLSHHSRVCAYDRAGYGWSDMGPLPRTTKRISQELYQLLQNAGINGPYVMVGHSFGGFTAQYFSRSFNEQIAGLVLVDSSHQEQVYRLPENGSDVVRRSIHQDRSNIVTRAEIHEHFPSEEVTVAKQLMQRWSALLTWREEMAGYALSSRQLRDVQHKPIPEVPLFVLTRGKRVWPETEYGNAMERVWMELQDDLNTLNASSMHILAMNSGHSIHLDQPALVVQAVQDVIDIFQENLN